MPFPIYPSTMIRFFIIIVASSLILPACKKKSKDEPAQPSITDLSAVSEKDGGDVVSIGSSISFHCNVTAQEGDKLSDYRLRFHSHARSSSDEYNLLDTTISEGFSGLSTAHVSGQSKIELGSPEGTYIFSVTATTENGDTATSNVELDVIIDPYAPMVLNVSVAHNRDSLVYHSGDTILVRFSAQASKDRNLASYQLTLKQPTAIGNALADQSKTQLFNSNADTVVDSVYLSQEAVGTVTLQIAVFDSENTVMVQQEHITVLPMKE